MMRTLLTRCVGYRGLHTTPSLRIDPKTVEEIRIPVPWGHIAGKWWGDKNAQPILAIHGLSDNCCTFDTLLPLVDVSSVLAIDLPGHGLSSHVAPGLSNDFTHILVCLRYLIKNHFGWPKVDFLGHSFGSCIAFAFSGLFPESVGKFVSIDCARFNMAGKGVAALPLLRLTTKLNLDPTLPQLPELTYEEHLRRFMEFRQGTGYGLSEKSSKILLKRLLREVGPNTFVGTADPRLPLYLSILPVSTLEELALKITCQVMSIRFSSGVFQRWNKEAYENQLDVMRKTASSLVAVDVDGSHHAHLEDPESVVSHINSFFKAA